MRKRWEAASAQNAQAPLPFRPVFRRAPVLPAGRVSWLLTHRFPRRHFLRVALRQPPGDYRKITWLRSDAAGALRGGKPRAPRRLNRRAGRTIKLLRRCLIDGVYTQVAAGIVFFLEIQIVIEYKALPIPEHLRVIQVGR